MYTNQLIKEKSPYLLQHAHNPVNWYPWKEEAFQKAGEEDKPIFLSIGYSTCHWCHVMERESFENEEIAEILNQNFISIKVDREERPDIDAVYMTACQLMLGQGGWPLTVFLTKDKKPFFIATYLPPYQRFGTAGLKEVLHHIKQEWKHGREKLLSNAEEVESYLKKQSEDKRKGELTEEIFQEAFKEFTKRFDRENGGFDFAPKFPIPHQLLFLIRYAKREKEQSKAALSMAEKTLLNMYRGGIFDHIGGGFSRYSTDNQWCIPHFEKMLYDNALLAYVYLEAYSFTENPLYQKVAKKILTYVERELMDIKGGFYCGQDADSEGMEGKFYALEQKELISLFGKEDAEYFCKWFHITEKGNFEGKNIPTLKKNQEIKKENNRIEELCERAYQYRKNRTKLHKDDKILTSWNGLMIAAFAKAAVSLKEEKYFLIAKRAEEFLSENLIKKDKIMLRFRDGEVGIEGMLEDYTFYCFSLLELYQASLEIRYLEKTIYYTTLMIEKFFDKKEGGFFLYEENAENLIIRPKEIYDGAIPSGNSAAVYVMAKLFQLTGEIKWQEILEKQIAYLAPKIQDYPTGYSFLLTGLFYVYGKGTEIVCTGELSTEDKRLLIQYLGKQEDTVAFIKTEENRERIAKIAPFTENYKIPEEGNLFYCCSNGQCHAPVYRLQEILSQEKN